MILRKALRDDHGGYLLRRLLPPTQTDYNAMIETRRRELDRLVDQLADKKITPLEFTTRLDAVLAEGHSEAWRLGRQLAGDLRLRHDADSAVGRTKADLESQFVQGLLMDLHTGRYASDAGDLRPGPIRSRLNLYLGKMRGTANEAWTEAGPENAEYDWKLGGAENHCGDCPYLAEGSPYTSETLPTHPGSGDTPCLGNCTCFLEREDGAEGFKSAKSVLGDAESDSGNGDLETPDTTEDPPLPTVGVGRDYLSTPKGRTLEDLAEEIRKYDREVVVIGSQDGEVLFAPVVGQRDEINVTGMTHEFKDRVILHNHPAATGISSRDLNVAIYSDAARIDAVLPDGRIYSVARPDGGWPEENPVALAAHAAWNRWSNRRSPGWNRRHAWNEYTKELNRALAKATNGKGNAITVIELKPKVR